MRIYVNINSRRMNKYSCKSVHILNNIFLDESFLLEI